MAHSLTPPPSPPATVTTPISGKISNSIGLPRLKVLACRQCQLSDRPVFTRRRTMTLIAGAVLGLSLKEESASAAGRRPPAPQPPAEEKRDPNVSGVQAKVLASKKRKEAMKDAVAKMRQQGKPLKQEKPEPLSAPPPPPPPPPPE